MCLYVEKTPEDLKPLTAEKDIVVYKRLLHRKYYEKYHKRMHLARIFTPFMQIPIEFNFWGKCVMEDDMEGGYNSREFPDIYDWRNNIAWKNGEIVSNKMILKFNKDVRITVNNGIHAYTTREAAEYDYGPMDVLGKVHKAVIPKGAHYFIGTGNEIVADKMIIYRKTYGRKWNK